MCTLAGWGYIRSVHERLALLAFISLCLVAPHASAEIASTFDDGLDGWTSNDGAVALANAGGYLSATDQSNGWHWLAAPRKFHGDWSIYGAVSLDVLGDVRNPSVYGVGLEISYGSNIATYEFPVDAVVSGQWPVLKTPLDAANWNVDGDWDQLIRSVSGFRIRIDLNNNSSGEKMQGLDNIGFVVRWRRARNRTPSPPVGRCPGLLMTGKRTALMRRSISRCARSISLSSARRWR